MQILKGISFKYIMYYIVYSIYIIKYYEESDLGKFNVTFITSS